MSRYWWLGVGLYVVSLLWYWALCRVSARSERRVREILNQPRDDRGLRIVP